MPAAAARTVRARGARAREALLRPARTRAHLARRVPRRMHRRVLVERRALVPTIALTLGLSDTAVSSLLPC